MRLNKLILLILSIISLSATWIMVIYFYIQGITTKHLLTQMISVGCFGLAMFASSYLYLTIKKGTYQD